jgi:hypothetical protein
MQADNITIVCLHIHGLIFYTSPPYRVRCPVAKGFSLELNFLAGIMFGSLNISLYDSVLSA